MGLINKSTEKYRDLSYTNMDLLRLLITWKYPNKGTQVIKMQ